MSPTNLIENIAIQNTPQAESLSELRISLEHKWGAATHESLDFNLETSDDVKRRLPPASLKDPLLSSDPFHDFDFKMTQIRNSLQAMVQETPNPISNDPPPSIPSTMPDLSSMKNELHDRMQSFAATHHHQVGDSSDNTSIGTDVLSELQIRSDARCSQLKSWKTLLASS